MEAIFGIGDKVKIINYGHYFYDPMLGNCDMIPEIVGCEGLIKEVSNSQGDYMYSLHGVPKKQSWFMENQLEMVSKNINR